jgi:hypothetical protein
MPTATRNTAATVDTNNPFLELRKHFRSNHPPSVFNRTDKLIRIGAKKRDHRSVHLSTLFQVSRSKFLARARDKFVRSLPV